LSNTLPRRLALPTVQVRPVISLRKKIYIMRVIKKNRVCPVERAGSLDNKIRRFLQNPNKILGPYIKSGMTVLDVGCGPGFFSIDLARMVGNSGQVIASDLQGGMLQKLKDKIQGTELEKRITLHKSEENKVGVSEQVDFVLLFYVVHEIPNKKSFFSEIEKILNTNGQILMVEPPFHVSKKEFGKAIRTARETGLIDTKGPKVLFSKAVLLKKG